MQGMQQKTRVLLVEDHPINQKVVSRMLARLSCTVHLAEDGEVGVQRAATGYDLIFMDCSMPRMDGYEDLPYYLVRIESMDGYPSIAGSLGLVNASDVKVFVQEEESGENTEDKSNK